MSAQKIPGVNIDAGLELYGGEMDIYVTVLESFVTNTPAALDKLRNVTKESLPDYVIAVHGIKSVSATIAAEEVSARAKKLETMAKAGDLPGVLAGNPDFIKDVEILVNDIRNWLKTSGNSFSD